VHRIALHLLQERLGLHRLRDEDRGTHDPVDRRVAPSGFVAEAELHQVLQVEHADDVVRVVVDDRNPRHALLEEDRHRVARRGGRVDRDHVGARDHDGAHERVGEVEHRVDQLAVVLFDELVLCCLVDDAEQLLLRGEGRSARGTGRHPVAQRHETVCERSEEDAHPADHRRRAAQQALGVLTTDSARARADHDERDAGHQHRGREHRPPDAVEQDRERDGHQHRCGSLGEDADEDDGVRVRLGIDRDPAEGGGIAPARAEIGKIGARGDAQRGVDRRHEPAEGDQQDRGDQQQRSGHARGRRRSATWKLRIRSFCRPNISRLSSGSA
jgi:hypothetical protein